MRNFILSPNFKNSVKASFLSLVILIISLNFGCCLNASAMFDEANSQNNENTKPKIMYRDELFDFGGTNLPSNEEETAYDIAIYHPPCNCPSTNIYENEFCVFKEKNLSKSIDGKTFFEDFKKVYYSHLNGNTDEEAAENASKERFPNPNDQDYQKTYKIQLFSGVNKAREKKYAQTASTPGDFKKKVCSDYYNYNINNFPKPSSESTCNNAPLKPKELAEIEDYQLRFMWDPSSC